MLQRKNQLPDHTLADRARRQLSNRGLRAPCEINVQVQSGVVTLSGKVEYAHQKQTALRAARGLEGARSIIDQVQVIPMRR
jgi:osmotically-inducible protein OsmY